MKGDKQIWQKGEATIEVLETPEGFADLKARNKRLSDANKDLLRKNENQREKLRIYNGYSKSWLFKIYLLFHKNDKGRNKSDSSKVN